MTLVAEIIDRAGGAGLLLRKTAPRGRDLLLLEFYDAQMRMVAGQWFRDPAQAAAVAAETRVTGGESDVHMLDGSGIVIQRSGADRRLPALRPIVNQHDARLVAHKAERRAVVRTADGDYTKVVRPSHLPLVTTPLTTIRVASLALPEVRATNPAEGTVVISALPGVTMQARLSDAAVSVGALATTAFAIGRALRELHELPVRPDRPPHDVPAELEVARLRLEAAEDYGLLGDRGWRAALDQAASWLAGPATPDVLVHRDLHDKQILVAEGRPIGLLDFDVCTTGEAALDLANLIAHFDLRSRQGLCHPSRSKACVHALLEGYAADPAVVDRVPGYLLTTRLRLAAVYAFRDAPRDLIEDLLEPTSIKGVLQ